MIKSSRKTAKKLRKFEDGGMAGKGPLQPTPKKEKTVEELANETFSRLTTIPGVSKTETPTPKVSTPAPKAKLLPGGFKDQAQKDAYIKNTKNLLKTKSVADLVKMKHGTAAGLAALGFKDEVKKAAPVAKAPVANKTTPNKVIPKKSKEDGQALKQKGIGQKRAGQLLKQMAKPRESFAKRHGLPEVPKNWTKAIDIAMGFVAPAGRAKGATNLFQLGSKLFKGGAKTKAGAEAIKKTVEVVKKGAETSKKGVDVLAKTAKTAKSNRAAITRAQKGGIDKILRKGEGLPKVKDVVQRAANTTKSNRAAIARKQKSGLDKMLKLGEGK